MTRKAPPIAAMFLHAVAAAFFCTAAAGQELQVYPPEVALNNGRDIERMVVVYTRPDGVTLDVTAEATVTIANEAVAFWEGGKLHPADDGETQVKVAYADASVQVPLTVGGAAVMPPASFRNDVLPVLMRADCNSGGCHGSARGKNGFRLSLFGFDPGHDYPALTREVRGRRLDASAPDESLMLLKPTGAVPHEGGTVVEKGGPMYNTLRQWIAEGAKDDPADLPALTGIELMPPAAVLPGKGAAHRFMVRARYSDGATRDVTETAILASSDGMTLSVDGKGMATAGEKGEVYMMARYGTFAVVSKVIVLEGEGQFAFPEVDPHNYIDELVFSKLKKLRIAPAERCSDATFLRRVYFDVLGLLPTVEETRAFLNDPAPDKRAKLVDALLERPEFAELWAMKWAEVLRVATSNQLDRKGMHRYNDWLRHAMASGVPLSDLVKELLTAEGGNFTNPAANFYLVENDPLVIAENVAQVFMGVQIKCAQCHNHPFERWTMDDYYSFAAFFSQVGRKASSDPRESIVFNRGSGEVKNLRDGKVMQPKFLGAETPPIQGDRRVALAEWLTSPDNPWFARNIANRVWAHYFGEGIVEPPDDVRVTNPPSNPELLDRIGKRLVEVNYDLRQLVRDICNSHTYQMATRPHEPGVGDTRNFAYRKVRRLPAEQMLDAIGQVTETKVKFPNLPKGARAVQVADGKSGIYFLDVFGRPPRDSVCTCERTGEPTLAQSLHLINGDTVRGAIGAGEGRLTRLLKEEAPPPGVVEELYLAAFCRYPTEAEQAPLVGHLQESEDKKAAMEDVFWAVLNSKEFMFTH